MACCDGCDLKRHLCTTSQQGLDMFAFALRFRPGSIVVYWCILMYIVVQLLHLWPRWQLLNDVWLHWLHAMRPASMRDIQTFSAAWMCRLSAWSQLCRLQLGYIVVHDLLESPGHWGVSSIKSCHPRSLHEDVGGRFCLSLLDCLQHLQLGPGSI